MALRGASKASDSEDSNNDQSIKVDVGAAGKKRGTFIKPETVEMEVKVARIVQPEISKEAQVNLDAQLKANEAAQIKAQADLAIQNARKPEDTKKQEVSLQAAKDKLRQGETLEEQKARRIKEEQSRRAAAQNVKPIAGKIAEEAVTKITPKLPGIHTIAENELNKLKEDLEALEKVAALHKQQNEAHLAEVQKKAQAAAELQRKNNLSFIQGSGLSPKIKPSAKASDQLERLQKVKEMLAQAQAEVTPTVTTSAVKNTAAKFEAVTDSVLATKDPVTVSKKNVSALVYNYTNKKSEDKPKPEPRRSRRIAQQVKETEQATKTVQSNAKKR